MVDKPEAGCDLCAGKCRGHSLGHADQWTPEPGSRAYAATPANGEQVERITAEKLGEIMQEEWGDICDDAQAHPLDMKHGRGTVLFYQPNHWTSQIAAALNRHFATLSTPTEDARSRVKVLEEALEAIVTYDATLPYLRTSSPEAFLGGCVRHVQAIARAALGDKETDRHG